jgi:hypothetical protein
MKAHPSERACEIEDSELVIICGAVGDSFYNLLRKPALIWSAD